MNIVSDQEIPPPDKLDSVLVDEMPTGTLYKLQEPLRVNGQNVIEAGECVLVADIAKLQLVIRLMLKKAGVVILPGYYMMEMSGVSSKVFTLLLPQEIPNEPTPGYASEVRGNGPVHTEKIPDVVPEPVTAERVAPVSSKLKDLPKNQPMLLAATYSMCMSGGRGILTKLPMDPAVTREASNKSVMIEAILLRKGQLIKMVEKDGQLVLQKWCNENDEIIIADPDFELAVSIPNGSVSEEKGTSAQTPRILTSSTGQSSVAQGRYLSNWGRPGQELKA